MDDAALSTVLLIALILAVLILTTATTYVLWRLGRVLEHIEHVLHNVALESDRVVEDVAMVRRVISGAPLIATITAWWRKLFNTKKKKQNKNDE